MSAKVVSQKQLDANRANAKHSTGPRTEEGKARVAANGIRSALISRDLASNDGDPAEILRDFNELLQDLLNQIKPKDRMETVLVERIAICYWRLRRAIRFESKAIQKSRQNAASPMAEISRQINGGKYEPFNIVLPAGDDLKRLISYEALIDGQLHRTLTQLRRLRSKPDA